MKNLYTLAAFFLILSANAQIITMDANFKNKLIALGIDTNNDGNIQQSEAAAVTTLTLGAPYNVTDIWGIGYFTNLTYLDISSQPIPELPSLTLPSLHTLNISNCTELQYLSCANNSLTTLNVSGATKLYNINCANNNLTSLSISNLPLLHEINCNNNNISTLTLSNLPALSYLNCNHNNISELSIATFTSMTQLQCDYNNLSSLTITDLPLLIEISCAHNNLTSLNINNVSLNILYCNYNQLTQLDLSSISYTNASMLMLGNNPLEVLLIKNGGTDEIEDLSNTNLQYICADAWEIPALQNSFPNAVVNSYCSFAPGGNNNAITGTVRMDSDNNGCSAADIALHNFKLNVSGTAQNGALFTNSNGGYTQYAGTETVTITPYFENPAYFNATPAQITQTFTGTGNVVNTDFCITPNGVHPDLEISILPLIDARPGFEAVYQIVVHNKGNQIHSGAISFLFDETVLDYVTGSPVPPATTSGNVSWNFTGLMPTESYTVLVMLSVNSPVESPAVNINDILTFTANITTTGTDETPADNIAVLNQVVIGSFDPNDKQVAEGATITPEQVGGYLHYIIRFQNSGTAEAINVVVKDMLAENLDWSTFQPISASHQYRATLNSNRAEFFFEGINLPAEEDDEPASHGFISFKIKPEAGAALGDVFENTAEIYFDYNAPIVTNTVETTVALLSNVDFDFNRYITAYPNPAKDIITLSVQQDINVNEINIYNMQGQLVLTTTGSLTVNTASLATGNYILQAVTDKGVTAQEIVKM